MEATTATLTRDMNEWTEEARDTSLGVDRAMDVYLCECSDPSCADVISLTRAEYEFVRSEPVRFAIAVNHENPEVDHVMSENRRFTTIETFYGLEAKIARTSDPRRSR